MKIRFGHVVVAAGFALAATILLVGTPTHPQSSPGLVQGQVPTAGQWNSFFAAKQDFLGFAPLSSSSVVGAPPVTVTSGAGVITVGLGAFPAAAYSLTAAGTLEYDGIAFAANPTTSNRGILSAAHFLSLSADQTGADTATAQNWFPGGGATQFNPPASTTYLFDGLLYLARAAGTTSHTITVSLAGTATFSSINWIQDCTSTTGNVFGTSSVGRLDNNNVAGTACTAASTVATENNIIRVQGMARINTAGTVIPQFKYSAAPGGAPTVKANSYFRLTAVGSNTVLAVGAFN